MTTLTQRIPFAKIQWQLEQGGVHPLLARLYAARGIKDAQELDYSLEALLPPAMLTGTKEAAVLLADALEAGARLLIVADYDCDGATACALGIRALRELANGRGATVDYLVPDRFILGYGLSPEVVELAVNHPNGPPDLIITVDNGIASLEGVARARELGIATLITDHHLPGDSLPQADCIVNPNQPGCNFPSKYLAGVGVMFYVMLALRSELRERGWFGESPEPNLGKFLDLVALGTVADMVPLDRNNRVLVHQGMKRMNAGRLCEGLSALLQTTGRLNHGVSSFDLGFILGPRLNAAGRLSDMGIGIECLLTNKVETALNLAQTLDQLNHERREIEAQMQDQALSLLEAIDLDNMPSGIALFDPEWHQGVVGLLATRLKDRASRPVIAFARGQNGEIKGSGRSIPGFHLRDALDMISKRTPGLLLRFGGHAMAAGLTVLEKDFPAFCEQFAKVVEEQVPPHALSRSIETDGALEAAYYNLETAYLLEAQIWGQGFPAPLFEDEFEVEQQRILKGKHLKLRLRKENRLIDGIQFNYAAEPGRRARIVYRLGINRFNGIESLQLVIEYLETVGC